MTGAEMPWQDYGLVGLVVGFALVGVVALTWWFVRGASHDMHVALNESRDSREQFTSYLQVTAREQTQVLVAVGNALQANTESMQRSEVRAEERHREVVMRLEEVERELKRMG